MCLGMSPPAGPADLAAFEYAYEFAVRLDLNFYFYHVGDTPCGFWTVRVTADVTNWW